MLNFLLFYRLVSFKISCSAELSIKCFYSLLARMVQDKLPIFLKLQEMFADSQINYKGCSLFAPHMA